uniref:Uncharacterized protein n=1 Tax=Micrurus paraensis TaxID=1970185 RepID=A0A2D4KQ63_9SAUR
MACTEGVLHILLFSLSGHLNQTSPQDCGGGTMQGNVYKRRMLTNCPLQTSIYSKQANVFIKQMAMTPLGIPWQMKAIKGGNRDGFTVQKVGTGKREREQVLVILTFSGNFYPSFRNVYG